MWGFMAALVASLLSLSPGGLEILTIDTGDEWANSTISAIPGHNVTTITATDIGGIDFTLFDVLYVTDAYINLSTPTWASELIARGPDIDTYINGGGFVIVGVEAFGGDSTTNGDEYNFLPSRLVDGQTVGTEVFGDDVVITDPTHPLFDGITSEDLSNWGASYHGSLPVGTLPVLATNVAGQVLIRGGSVGAGGVFVWSLDPDFHFSDAKPGTLALVENAIGLVQAGPPCPCDLIVNGDFSQGNTGFTTDYTFIPGDIFAAGTYDILADPSQAHDRAASYGDHTSGRGLMMAVNGTVTPNQVVWSQTVDVVDNEEHIFSMWVSSWHSTSPAQLQVLINTVPIAPAFQAPSETGVWVNYSATWNSMKETTAVIEIIDQNLSSAGNDFALDDISFHGSPACPWDLDGDGTVGILDLLMLLAAWKADPGGPPDFDGDGNVNIFDLKVLLANWGPCP